MRAPHISMRDFACPSAHLVVCLFAGLGFLTACRSICKSACLLSLSRSCSRFLFLSLFLQCVLYITCQIFVLILRTGRNLQWHPYGKEGAKTRWHYEDSLAIINRASRDVKRPTGKCAEVLNILQRFVCGDFGKIPMGERQQINTCAACPYTGFDRAKQRKRLVEPFGARLWE